MRSTLGTIAVVLCLLLRPSISEARGPYGSITVGSWNGGAFTNNDDGSFSHCAAVATYKSGIHFVVVVSASLGWRLAFAHPDWKLTPGTTFPLAITFDGQAAFNLQGQPIDANLVGVDMPDNSKLIAQFRKAKVMTVFAQGNLFQFSLDHTADLLPSLVNCVASTKKNGIGNATEFAVTLPKQTTAKPAIAAASVQPSSSPPASEKTYNQTGTGFVISANGHVVTNQHVIGGCIDDIKGNLSGEPQVLLRLVSSDETNDLALLQASTPFKAIATIREKPIHPGDSVVAIGFPLHGLLTSDFTVTTGIVSSLSGILNDTRYLQISAAVQQGNSGGPLLDSAGVVVGMVAAKLNALKFAKATGDLPENVNFAIKTGALRDFLDNSVVAYQIADAKQELKTSEIASGARAFTLLISCKASESAAAK
jgi:S1-C subfamily serine protease